MASRSLGYLAVLRQNARFRRLWYAQVASQLGDWFSLIALFTLLERLTGSGEASGLLIVAQFLPATVVGLWSGVIVDRLPRRWVMVASDLGNAVLVLLFLLVRTADQVWIVYAVTVLKVVLLAFFEPARTAIIQSLTSRDELVAANAVSGATWAVMLAIGAALGGFVTGVLGTAAAFLIDSLTFLASAAFVASLPVQETHLDQRVATSQLQELREGLAFTFRRLNIALYALTKTLWSMGGGIMLVLALFGERVFQVGQGGAVSVGVLYMARGIGAGIGPVLAQRLGGQSMRFLQRAVGPGFLFTAAGYSCLALAPSLPLAAGAVLLAHLGGSTQWVYSTTLLQLSVPNRMQGRVFAVELALLTCATAASNYLVGVASDGGWPPRALALAVAGTFALTGIPLTILFWIVTPAEPAAEDEIVRG
jgi:predicted MFS family arabinose efflux permease